MTGPAIAWLADGRRLHMNHGPIDLIVEAFGAGKERQAAYAQAVQRFETVLEELVFDLPLLRQPVAETPRAFRFATAGRMEGAAIRHYPAFVTPMAAVAGSVADEVLSAILAGRSLDRAYVNNGGDVALYLASGESMNAAIAGTGHGLSDRVTIHAADSIRGIATSGWHGRSHSLGIADAVTVLAEDAAAADVAATLIANAVDLPGHPRITRVPARLLAPDSDLGERPVTQHVGPLSHGDVASALDRGLAVAHSMAERGLIHSAALFLRGEARICGWLAAGDSSTYKIPKRNMCHA